jgi:hypothetical protein
VTSSASQGVAVATTLTIGGVSDTYSVTTVAAPIGDDDGGAIGLGTLLLVLPGLWLRRRRRA